jgi:very-short-patch-repair endonuclease
VATLLKQLSGLIVPIIVVVVVVIVLVLLKGLWRGKVSPAVEGDDLPYEARDALMTPSERSFFGVLEQVVDATKYRICPQITLASLVTVKRGTSAYQSYHNKIDRKTVDYVLVTRDTLEPRLAVELDDSTHDRESRKERDAFVDDVLATAELPLLHVKARSADNPKALAEEINGALTAQTPYGGSI